MFGWVIVSRQLVTILYLVLIRSRQRRKTTIKRRRSYHLTRPQVILLGKSF
jgi:hypothetical protein